MQKVRLSMKGVKFGNLHSYYEWGLILSSKEIQSPKPKVNQIDIEGSDGVLDLTEFFGDVKFENRSLSFTFTKKDIVPDGFLALYSLVQNTIHGKKMQVILDDDPMNYYFGRVTINEWKSDKKKGIIVIEVDAEPYKYNLYESEVMQMVSGTDTIVLPNSRKRVVPTITTNAQFTITFGNYTGVFSAGTFKIPELELIEGDNIVTVTGTGTITFTYRMGGL